MAATPPLQIADSPHTPPTPLHGAMYDYENSPRRTSARLRHKRTFDEAIRQSPDRPSRSVKTPNSPRTFGFEPNSPDRTPQRKSAGRHVRIMSPTSPDSDNFAPRPNKQHAPNNQPFLATTTTITEGMLPTPVKTPNKKQKLINKSDIAARALFQDHITSEEMAPSPRRQRKNKRHNGFSLETFRAETAQGGKGVQIFTDTRDQIPEVDHDEDNPFVDHGHHDATSKEGSVNMEKRKASKPQKLDSQVEEALEDDEGMVYVFRGKKVYRRFDDTGEEEEEIDADDLGLLEHAAEGKRVVKPLKTLTRKSIRPTRLFQTEAQKRARELEKEEEAATDIDETPHQPSGSSKLDGGEPSRAEDAIRATRSKAKPSTPDPNATGRANGKPGGKKGSPFDTWARIKPGSASSSSAMKQTRSRKRGASPSFEESSNTRARTEL